MSKGRGDEITRAIERADRAAAVPVPFIDEVTAEHQTPVEPAGGPRLGSAPAYLIAISGSSMGEMFKLSGSAEILGRAQDATFRILDESVSRQHARFHRIDDKTTIEDMGSRNGTYVNGVRVERQVLRHGDKIQVGASTVLKFSSSQDLLDDAFEREMYRSALRDGLTGVYNKRYFQERFEAEFRFATRHRAPLSLIMLDIDLFKTVNDTYGHLAGDRVLEQLAYRVQGTVRQEDVVARFGGEEFVIICRGTDQAQALALAERIRFAVAALEVAHEGITLKVTVSIGVAGFPDLQATTPEQLIEAADSALYAAKNTGRNRVKTFTRA
jgi:diguanylate cyclase (GGDEF)-like protein